MRSPRPPAPCESSFLLAERFSASLGKANSPPNFQQLLGPYYQQAQQASASQQPRARRAPIGIETPGLVFQQTGHARSFHGVAYIPQLMPNGVQASDIR